MRPFSSIISTTAVDHAAKSVVVALLACCTLLAHAAPPAKISQVTPAQPVSTSGDKIEVLEFFSYACPHCKDFHPQIEAWAKQLPKDVKFTRVPVSFGRQAWVNLSKLYYALEASDQLKRFDGAVFVGIHNERTNLYSGPAAAKWLALKGGDAERFISAFNSFGVQSKAKRASQLSRHYKVSGVPSMAVNGKFMVEGNENGFDGMLRAVDQLVEQERKANK